MNFIVANLLLNLDPALYPNTLESFNMKHISDDEYEEWAFRIFAFINLSDEIKWRELYG